jgi:uncharacterized protein
MMILLFSCPLFANQILAQELRTSSTNSISYVGTSKHLNNIYASLFSDFNKAAKDFDEITSRSCENLDKYPGKTVKKSFERLYDSYSSVEVINFGALEKDLRSFELNFWPDKRNVLSRQIKPILNSTGEVITVSTFKDLSLALKGLTAVERILYNSEGKVVINNKSHINICRYLTYIAKNIHTISKAVHKEWKENKKHTFSSNKNIHKEKVANFYQAFHDLVEKIYVQKLQKPYISKTKSINIRKLENYRSKRSFRAIAINTKSLKNLYEGNGLSSLLKQTKDTKSIQKNIKIDKKISKLLNKISLSPILKIKDYDINTKEYRGLMSDFEQLQNIVTTGLSEGIQIPLGFNGADGD